MEYKISYKGINSLKEVRKELKKNGVSFPYSFKNWCKIEFNNSNLYLTKKDGTIICYTNTFGSFGFPVCIK